MNVSQLFDHHVHSIFSQDSQQAYEPLIQAAIASGKTALVTTEHYEPIYAESQFFCADLVQYPAAIAAYQHQYPQLKLLKGLEIGYESSCVTATQQIIDTAGMDLIIVSIHTLRAGKDVAGESKAHGCWPYSDDVVGEYFQAALDAVQQLERFQIFGHLDYVFRYIEPKHLNIERYEAVLTQFFEILIAKDIALDLNTAGWRYGLPHPHPQPSLLALYRKLGGKRICLGSDAHRIEDLNADFARALTLLQSLGFEAITSYESGQAQQIPLTAIRF